MYSGPAYGLFTSPNPFSSTPAGSLKVADNVYFSAPSVLEPRRGLTEMALSSFGDSNSRADVLTYYDDDVLVSFDSDSIAIKSPTSPFVTFYGSFEPPGEYRMPFQPASRSMFFSTAAGVYVFDSPAAEGHATVAFKSGKAVAYVSGAGALTAGATVTGGTSGATGTLTVRTGTTAGVLYLRDVTGTFVGAETVTGPASFSATTSGSPTAAVLVSNATPTPVEEMAITGLTSTARAIISDINAAGAYTALSLTDIGPVSTASFSAGETVVFSEDPLLQPYLAGNPQGLDIAAVANNDDGWQSPGTAVAYRFTICSKDRFERVIEGPPSGRVTLRNPLLVSAIGGMTYPNFPATSQTVTVVTTEAHGLAAADSFTLTPGEAHYEAGTYVVDAVLSPTSFTFTSIYTGPYPASTLEQNIEVTRAATVICYLPFALPGTPIADYVFLESLTRKFIRVYRSEATLTADAVPFDELFQCYESAYLTETDITTGYLAFIDVMPESALSEPLYTNPNRDGALTANYQPPKAESLAYFANRMWFANTTNKPALRVSLIGVGSPDGIQVGDYFSVDFPYVTPAPGALTLTGVAAGSSPGANEFEVFTDGTPGQNIERTAKSLCLQLSLSTANDFFYAYYVSAEGDVPGQMLFQGKGYGDDFGMRAYSDRPTAWTPQLPTLVTPLWDAPESDDNRHAAGLWYSKLAQPESVPPKNYLPVDADNDAILRIFPLNYRLIIFKTSGIYFCTNTEPFSIQKLSEYRLVAPDSVQVLDEKLYALTDQGIVIVGDSGVGVVSVPIDATLTGMLGPTSLASVKTRTVAVAYRSAQQYLCWLVEQDEYGDFSADNAQAYVFSTLSNGFTRYPFGARAAAIDGASDRLVLAPTNDNVLWQENKTYTVEDFVDLTVASGTLVAVTGDVLELASVSGVTAGDVIAANGDTYLVTEVDAGANAITTFGPTGWTVGDAYEVKQAIATEVTFNDFTEGKPATMKMAQQATLLFRANGIYETVAAFASEITPVGEEVSLFADSWGLFPWGEIPYGGVGRRLSRVQPLPISAGNCCQLGVGFTTRQARAKYEFLGVDVVSAKDTEANRG